jgi:hypothetical protein
MAAGLLTRHGPQGLLPVPASAGLIVDGDPPAQYADLLSFLREVFSLEYVDIGLLQEVKLAAIYKEFTLTPPTLLGERLRPDMAGIPSGLFYFYWEGEDANKSHESVI